MCIMSNDNDPPTHTPSWKFPNDTSPGIANTMYTQILRCVIFKVLQLTGHLQIYHPQNFVENGMGYINWRAGYM